MTESATYLSLWHGHVRRAPPTMASIAAEVCERHGIKVEELRGETRVRGVSWPRQEFMGRAYETGRWSYPRIGRFLSRDHTTVMHGHRRWREREGMEPLPKRPGSYQNDGIGGNGGPPLEAWG